MINIYNIDTEAVRFLRAAWQLSSYGSVQQLVAQQPAHRRVFCSWLLHTAARGGDDITDVTQARDLLQKYATRHTE